MLKKILSLSLVWIIIVSLLSGCGSEDNWSIEVKQPFQIQTLNLYNADNMWYITKSAQIQWSSEVTISSTVSWRIKNIVRHIGDNVSLNNLLIQLQDTTSTFDKAIKDAQIAYQRAQLSEEFANADIEQQLKKLQYDLNNVDPSIVWSNTQLQLDKLEKDLEKAEFDYQSKLKSDNQTNENLITSARNIQSDLDIILTDTSTETDKLLWITDLYINWEYKDLRIYLGAKDIALKDKVTTSFYTISSLQKKLDTMNSSDITDENVTTYLKTYQSIVTSLSDHFVLMKKIFIESIEDARYKAQMTLSQNTFTALQTKNSSINASITSQLNTIRSYFSSYEDQQQSLWKQIESLRSQIDLARKSLEDAQFNANIWADRSELWFDNQIQNANLSTQSAYLQLQQANLNKSKFSITSPIQWTIADVMVDIWQEVSPWAPLLKVVSNQQQIETKVTIDELKNISLWQKVIIESQMGEWEWMVVQISQTADKSWSFKVIIVLQRSTIPTGMFVTLKIPVQKGALLLPLNALSIVDTNAAVAYFWDWSQIVPKTLTINSIFGDQVEIVDKIPTHYELIISDVTNYDERTMQIVKK
jgi:multidrug resistance efflux pump